MSLLPAARTTRIIALMSFAGAFFFHQYTKDLRPGPWQDDSATAGAGKTSVREPRTPQLQDTSGNSRNYNWELENEVVEDYQFGNHLQEDSHGSGERKRMQETSSEAEEGTGSEGGGKARRKGHLREEEARREGHLRKEARREGHLREVGGGMEGDDNTTLLLPVLKPSSGALLTKLDLSGYSKEDKLFLRWRLKELSKRAQMVSKMCVKSPPSKSPSPTYHLTLLWHLQASPPLLYCPIHQVASEVWTAILLRQAQLAHDDTEGRALPPRQEEESRDKVREARSQSDVVGLLSPPDNPREREAVFRDSLRMIVVRHPFSRIISVYRDKMIKMGPDHHFNSLQRKIVSEYRSLASGDTSQFPSFSEFVQYILTTTETLRTREEWLTQERLWTPYWVLCNVCGADYNLVLQLETMQEDMKFLAKLTHKYQLGKMKKEWQRLRNSTIIYLDLQKHYFDQLAVEQIQRLRNIYLIDMILFGYHVE